MGARAARDQHGQRLGTRVAFEGVREVGGGGDTRPRAVADEPAQQDQRPVLARRTEVGLVGDPLRVEREQVTEDGGGVEEADRRVVGGTDGQAAERRVRR